MAAVHEWQAGDLTAVELRNPSPPCRTNLHNRSEIDDYEVRGRHCSPSREHCIICTAPICRFSSVCCEVPPTGSQHGTNNRSPNPAPCRLPMFARTSTSAATCCASGASPTTASRWTPPVSGRQLVLLGRADLLPVGVHMLPCLHHLATLQPSIATHCLLSLPLPCLPQTTTHPTPSRAAALCWRGSRTPCHSRPSEAPSAASHGCRLMGGAPLCALLILHFCSKYSTVTTPFDFLSVLALY